MKIGLIGYGFMGAAHAAAIASLPGVTLKAVASRTRPDPEAPVRGNLSLASVPLPEAVEWHPDWRSVVADRGLDAVDICLPTPAHKEVILAAFAHGKHVLCEKPMALTPEDCDEILEAAGRVGRTFMVAQVLRFMTPYRIAGEFVRAHPGVERCALRRVTGFPGWSGWLGDPAQSGGAILDLLSHDLDQALQWFGQPRSVAAAAAGEVDTARISMTFAATSKVTVEGGWLAPETPFAQSFQIQAPEASLSLSDGRLIETRGGNAREIEVPSQDAYAEEIAYFLDCCRSGKEPTQCPPTASADAVRLATLARRSREQNGKVMPWN